AFRSADHHAFAHEKLGLMRRLSLHQTSVTGVHSMRAVLHLLVVLLLATAGMSVYGAELRTTGQAADRRQHLAAVDNWGYWLDSLEISGVMAAPHDLLVIDSEISANRLFEREYDSREIARMKRRRD